MHSGRRNSEFLGQSTRSNYCGVYACAMLMSLLGFSTARAVALAAFRTGTSISDYPGTTLQMISEVLTEKTHVREPRWQVYRHFPTDRIRRALAGHFARTGDPTILCFGARLRAAGLRGRHAVVALGINSSGIRILDPLGSAPSALSFGNAILRHPLGTDFAPVDGCPYDLLPARAAAVLTWSGGF